MSYKVSDENGTRDATPDETATLDIHAATHEKLKLADDTKAAAVASAHAKLKALGLTDAEIKALVG